ncbi:AraC family transcriptional regulator N-terminal domain-containing protein [Acinetobacter puyangensis]|uniref:AraC family transcriptional regulator n=1 Tax=Acinetobacter puyangensis TaxID=1096779 RepID=UPI003A4DD232
MGYKKLSTLESTLNELKELVLQIETQNIHSLLPRVAMVRGEIAEHKLTALYDPMLNLVLEGSKTMAIGNQIHHYNPANYFMMSVDLPAMGKLHSAKNGAPYLALSLTLDAKIVADLLNDISHTMPNKAYHSGFSVAPVTFELLDAWVRLLRLMNKPDEIFTLASIYEREILFRVLQGPLGKILHDMATADTLLARINLAIHWLKINFNQSIKMEKLAAMTALSVSAFHRHFKAITALSPLQFQKRIRLLHARSLLLSGEGNVTTVAFEVGYRSSHQFSREYARSFGLPPSKDIARLKKNLAQF